MLLLMFTLYTWGHFPFSKPGSKSWWQPHKAQLHRVLTLIFLSNLSMQVKPAKSNPGKLWVKPMSGWLGYEDMRGAAGCRRAAIQLQSCTVFTSLRATSHWLPCQGAVLSSSVNRAIGFLSGWLRKTWVVTDQDELDVGELLGWVEASWWQLSPHPVAHSLYPRETGERVGKPKVRKTHGSRWRQFNKWMGKKRSQLMQRQSLITSHQQSYAQSAFKQQLSTKSPCFIDEHDVYGVKYPWAVWVSSPLPASCLLLAYSQPTHGAAELETEKSLVLWKHCSATAKTWMCYLHCFGHKSKPQHCAAYLKKVTSTSTSLAVPITWALPGRFRLLLSSFSFENQKFLFPCLFSDLYNKWGRTLKRLKVFFTLQIWGWHLASILCRLPLRKRKCYPKHKDHLPTRFQDCDAKPGKWEFLKENIYRLLTQTTIYTFPP